MSDARTEALLDENHPGEGRASAHLRELSQSAETALSTLTRLDLGENADLFIRDEIGRGGMGRVVLVNQRLLRRDVAMKVLPDGPSTAGAARALLNEAVALGQIEHPNVVPVHQLGLDERGLPALVMKRISGVGWDVVLADRTHPLIRRFGHGESDALDAHIEILMHVCDAVHFAHLHGIVHLDIKAGNVMVGQHGEVYLVDWGLARSMLDPAAVSGSSRSVSGTPGYMAPEMALGGVIDARSDVFLLGSTLYFVLTGRMRHEGSSLMDIMLHAASPEPVEDDPDLPDELVALVNHATAKRPEDRPQSAEEFREALAAWRRHRVSHQLRKEATIRLAQLQGLRAARVVSAPELMRLATECRFGFAQALREWPDNREAKVGLRACLQEMVLWAVMHGDATTARSLLEELSPPDPELVGRVESLERKLQKQKLRANKAIELEKDRDLKVAGSNRLQLLLRFVIVLLVVRLALLVLRGPESASAPKTLLGVGAFAFVFMALGTLWGRRALLSNEVNRQIIGTVLMMLAGIFANRAHGYIAGLSGAVIMVGDSLVAALSSAMGAMSIRKQVGWAALVNLTGAVVSTVWPAYAAYSFSITSLGGLLFVAYVLDLPPDRTP